MRTWKEDGCREKMRRDQMGKIRIDVGSMSLLEVEFYTNGECLYSRCGKAKLLGHS